METMKPSLKQRIATKVAFAALIVSAVIVGIFVYWASADSDVLQVKNSPFPVKYIPNNDTPNGLVLINVNYCKNADVVGKLRMSWVSDTREIFLPLVDENTPKGCSHRDIPIIIPDTLTNGDYKIKFRATYNLNPLKTEVTSEFESRTFNINNTHLSTD